LSVSAFDIDPDDDKLAAQLGSIKWEIGPATVQAVALVADKHAFGRIPCRSRAEDQLCSSW
jgi:hypothetical protein